MPQSYKGYEIPAYTDDADAVKAFQDYTDSVVSNLEAEDTVIAALRDKVDLKADWSVPTSSVTDATYTLTLEDGEQIVTFNNADGVVATVPAQDNVGWTEYSTIRVVNYGDGDVTIKGGAGVTVANAAAVVEKFGAATLLRDGKDSWTLVPFSAGGGASQAEFSVPGVTPVDNVSDGSDGIEGATYRTWTIAASSFISCNKAGYAELAIAGAGGGGGGGSSAYPYGGGGAGGMFYSLGQEFQVGTYEATVGVAGNGNGHAGGDTSLTNDDAGMAIVCGGGGGSWATGTYGGCEYRGARPGSGGGGDGGGGGNSANPGRGACAGQENTRYLFGGTQYICGASGYGHRTGASSRATQGGHGVVFLRTIVKYP